MDMKNLRYYIAIALGTFIFFFYWFSEGGDVTYERPVHDEKMVAAGKKLATEGRGEILACTTCHGQNGEGMFEANYPRLAGLNAVYIKKQLEDFARPLPEIGVVVEKISRDYEKTPKDFQDLTVFSPGVRHGDIMSPIAKSLTKEDIANLSAYYSGLAFTATPKAVDHLTLERGQDLALRGKPEYMVPACIKCHGLYGEGFREIFPPLAGQPVGYIIDQINKMQDGSRDNDNLAMMKNIANMLTDADKVNIARFYSNMSLTINEDK
jgi:cytochrome c553